MFDLAGKTGVAALTLETLLAVNPQLKDEVESLQGKIDWGLNWDTTWFHVETPANNFDAVFEILARLLVVDNIRPDAFNRAHQERLRSEEHTSELQSLRHLVCRLLLEKKKPTIHRHHNNN